MTRAKETIKASNLFNEYAIMGYGRSLRKLAAQLVDEELSKRQQEAITKGVVYPRTTDEWRRKREDSWFKMLGSYSARYGWAERAKEYDRERAEEKRRKREEALEKMNDAHATLGSGMAVRAAKTIQELIDAKRFGSTAAVMLFKEATTLERLARGAATEQVALEAAQATFGSVSAANSIVLDLTRLSDTQLVLVEKLLEEVEGKKTETEIEEIE